MIALTVGHGTARDAPRCQHCLEVPLPDAGDGYENSTLILQCERETHRRGVHRYSAQITWSTRPEAL